MEILEVVQRMPRAKRRTVTLETVGYTAEGGSASQSDGPPGGW